MTSARLALIALLVSSASTFAQMPGALVTPHTDPAAKTLPSESWKIGGQPADSSAAGNPIERMRIDQFKLDPKGLPFQQDARADLMTLNLDGQAGDDTTCFAIRSYVVARDSKNSDATHPVGYSTCRPASRYRVRTTELHSTSVNR
ncbi:MAG: hypothetical protein WCB05_13400 [Candidatus Sulfotelmatobacter sp.]